jgi:hypothetical protein
VLQSLVYPSRRELSVVFASSTRWCTWRTH